MNLSVDFGGVYAASITPFDASGRPSHEQLVAHLAHLEKRGCRGALLSGTTGEGLSLSVAERIDLFAVAVGAGTGLRLLAGTGAVSLDDAVSLTRAAYDAGCSAAVIIPPFFYRDAPLEGLAAFYSQIMDRAVPGDGLVLLYHNPAVAGIGVSIDLIERLRDAFPRQVVGIKNSSSDWDYASQLIEKFPGFQVLVGDDRLVARALQAGGVGSITGLTNVFPNLFRDVYRLHEQNRLLEEAQARIDQVKRQFDGVARIAAFKRLLVAGHIIQSDQLRPPLRPLTGEEFARLEERFHLDANATEAVNLDDLAYAL